MSVHSVPELETRRSTRQRVLTSPAREEFQSRVSKYASQLREVKNDLNAGISHIDEVKTDSNALVSVRNLIDSCYRAYCELSAKFIEYLRTVRTTESYGEEVAHNLIKETVDCKVDMAFKRLSLLLNPPFKSKDGHSTRSSSSLSKKSSVVERKQAELDATVIRKKFLDAEADIIQQKVALESRLQALKLQQDIEIKQAEIDAIQNTAVKLELGSVTSSKKHARTQEYVDSLPDPISCMRDPDLEVTNSFEDNITNPDVTTHPKRALPLSSVDVNIASQQQPVVTEPLPVQTSSQHTINLEPDIRHTYISTSEHEFPRQHYPTQTTTVQSAFKPRFSSSQLQLPKPHFRLDSAPQGHTEVQSQLNPLASPFMSEKSALQVKWRHCTAETRQDVYNCVASLSRNHHNIPQLANDDQQPVVFYNCKEF
ncbi:hypothetical protein KUTeg_015386 [Tegillarca granosa]|uniref:Uncharacterized protein n=1 Tax=Tegillarca granosa TaxID=220873 RepID=A0ABQ9EUP5_TEGGR|nr:hypothetical protein KUTeg_015386 [Tegillarca granosa]